MLETLYVRYKGMTPQFKGIVAVKMLVPKKCL